MLKRRWVVAVVLLVSGTVRAHADGVTPVWSENVRRVHARFSGRPGTFAQFGDSITVTQAFWSPLRGERKHAPAAMEGAFTRVNGYLKPECWREWKGPDFGSEGGKTVGWADENVGAWLKKLHPEVALVMFGTNDLHDLTPAEYHARLRSVVRKCLDHGTAVILSTIPPRHGYAAKAARFAEVARQVARELLVPVSDFHAEILKRRPNDWDGASEAFTAYSGYEVPTLTARDGVHPSFPQRYQNDYSDEALCSSGFTLRTYLTVLAYDEVIRSLHLVG